MRFAPEYVRYVLNDNFEDAKRLFLSPLMAIHCAHLVMLADRAIIGPTDAHLKKLRDDWKKFLQSANGKKQLKEIRDAARRTEELLGASEFDNLVSSLRLQAEMFGDPNEVTPPNLASLTLLV